MDQPTRWTAILLRIGNHDADDLDAIVGPFDPRRRAPGRDLFAESDAVLRQASPMKRPDAVCVGLRVLAELPDAADRALRLAAFAIERDVEIVVLAHCDRTGLERFGFRCERIAGDDPAARAACEDQVRRFWNIDLVL
ncbi:MAG: hypothetical protein U1E34_08895 [Amaricoccus sp.]